MSVYETMQHNKTHKVKETGVSTTLVTHSDHYALQYHDTEVVQAYPDGRVVLHTNGYETSTTKERINRYLPGTWRLFQRNYAFYLTDGTVQYANQ